MINSNNTDLITLTLEEHIKLLKGLGYIVDATSEEIPKHRRVNIYKKENVIGDIAFENKNMFYLYRDNRIVGNRDLSKINFNKRKIKNIRAVIHLRLHDYNLKFNGYNQLINDDRNFITITDNETYKITKFFNDEEIQIKSLISDISDEEILKYLKQPKEKTLTYNIKGV